MGSTAGLAQNTAHTATTPAIADHGARRHGLDIDRGRPCMYARSTVSGPQTRLHSHMMMLRAVGRLCQPASSHAPTKQT